MLCDVCRDVDFDQLIYEWKPSGYAHHASLSALAECSDCAFCAGLWETLKDDSQIMEIAGRGDAGWHGEQMCFRLVPSSDGIGIEHDRSTLIVFVTDRGAQTTLLGMYGVFVNRTKAECDTNKIDPTRCGHSLGIMGRPVSPFSNSDECFRLAGMWLDECLEQNELESETSSSFMPTRTIDVGAADGSEDPRLAVHDTDGPVTRNGWPQRLPWLTLTHCWGGSSPLMLTHDTLAEWTASGIPMPLLPLTFRDAVSITRRLGYRHLWIDSICIVQDSRQDWEREAARMGDVYRHGVLNISASSGRGCRDGIFGKRGSSTTPALAAVRLPFNSKRLGIGGEWLYLRAGRWDNYLEYITGRQHNTLASRGWVLQESLLSPRTLHFASQQLFWECTHATYAEGRIDALALPDNKMTALQAPHVYSYKMMLPSVLHWPAGTAADAAARDEMHSLWLRVVENYSSRALTVPSDVFPALAGVASVFQARLGDRYLAGLFRRHLLEGFVWRSIDPARSTLRPQSDACSAPSWSWASLIGGVQCEVVIDSNGIMPKMVGTGSMARVVEEEPRLAIEGHAIEGTSVLARNYHVLAESMGEPPNNETRTCVSFLDTSSPSSGRLLLLHLGIWQWHFRREELSISRLVRKYCGLLLEAVDGTGSVYRRIGVAMLKVAVGKTHDAALKPEDEVGLQTWERRVVTVV